ncbi:MAG: PTPA-CTERM sorting domain-containing protein, partial [Leptolyngbya sp. SIO3F4]|nr:PTPA-CTERM sorting domain-containing protein [Leptolyngbya sp. SIO3F4]
GDVIYTESRDSNAIPTPALLPGLIGMGWATIRKRKQEASKIDCL